MAERGNVGIGKLASTLDNRMSEHQSGQFTPDFGTIKSDMSLVTDTFPTPISDEDYSVCRHLSGYDITGGSHGGHNSGNGSHSHELPTLKPGDRVLVIWANEEAVVVDIIVKASSI